MKEKLLKFKNIRSLKNFKEIFSNIIIWIIFLASAFFVYKTINNYNNIEITLSNITNNLLSKSNIAHFILLTLLLIANWSLEALKWQILIEKIEYISFRKSFISVISGITLSIISILGFAGVIAGRIWHLKSKKRIEVLGAMGINSFFQTIVTLLWGCFGVIIYFNHRKLLSDNYSILFFIVTIILHYLIIWIISKKIKSINLLKPLFKVIYKYIKLIEEYNVEVILKVYVLSFMRYLIFITQFAVILNAFNVNIEFVYLLSAVSLMFLSKSFAFNTNVFVDLGIREFTAIFFLGYYGVDELTTICATFILWFINIISPSVIGLFFIFKMKIFLPKKSS